VFQSINIEREESKKPTRVTVNGQEFALIDRYEGVRSPTGTFGCTRWVYIGDDFVVKIKGKNTSYDAMGDVKLFIAPEDQKHFALIVYVDINKQWFVQERVNCVPNIEPSDEDRSLLRTLQQKYGIADLAGLDQAGLFGGDLHNWTVDINGTPIIYDYDF
jgi:hypothetical protein